MTGISGSLFFHIQRNSVTVRIDVTTLCTEAMISLFCKRNYSVPQGRISLKISVLRSNQSYYVKATPGYDVLVHGLKSYALACFSGPLLPRTLQRKLKSERRITVMIFLCFGDLLLVKGFTRG